jgi:hypothetical protein
MKEYIGDPPTKCEICSKPFKAVFVGLGLGKGKTYVFVAEKWWEADSIPIDALAFMLIDISKSAGKELDKDLDEAKVKDRDSFHKAAVLIEMLLSRYINVDSFENNGSLILRYLARRFKNREYFVATFGAERCKEASAVAEEALIRVMSNPEQGKPNV